MYGCMYICMFLYFQYTNIITTNIYILIKCLFNLDKHINVKQYSTKNKVYSITTLPLFITLGKLMWICYCGLKA